MSADAERLSRILAEQIRCAEAMLETLTSEHRALADGDHAALELATQAKAKLVDALERLESERSGLVLRDDAAVTAEWQRLRELVARCKEHNHLNGTLLHARAENVRIALKALRGSEPELYGASGRAGGHAGARPLGTA